MAHASFESLSEKLLIERLALWGLQFDGHGALVLRCPNCDTINRLDAAMCAACGARLSGTSQVGGLAFESNGNVEWVLAQQFGSILYNAQVQLAMLLACETARLGGQWMFSGLAPSLMLAGVPAVIGMQYPISDRFANGFASSFYKALLWQVEGLSCPLGATPDQIGEYAAGASGLQNLDDGYYQFNCKSPKTYANSCKTMKLDLGEGPGRERISLFQFTK